MRYNALFITAVFAVATPSLCAQELPKTASVLYPAEVMAQVRENVANDPWAAGVRNRCVEAAAHWRDMSDDALWELMFGPELKRSWMVWSNGHSPITGEPVPMYNWVADARAHPWKLQDPTSGEWFPKNDFEAYYHSGLNSAGRFDASRADHALLFNTEHPDPEDPLHTFGVDDGSGYVNDKEERWRFVATYLIYGQWKQLVVGGIRVLSAAHVLTGDPVYARKAGILVDRVADFYPEFDFGEQGILYEGPGASGYVTTWHDACEETREMVLCYDMIFDAIRQDTELPAFLSRKAAEAGLERPKTAFADIQRNIEQGILRDALAHPNKIHSNYPRAEILKAVTVAVLAEPEERFWALVDPMMARTTAVDGVTGEKGLAGYASYTIQALASFLSEFSKAGPAFLDDLLERYPQLVDTYRFHLDTLCLQRYYPLSGDTGHFAGPMDRYVGMNFDKPGENILGRNWTLLAPSNYRLLWRLYEATSDTLFAQAIHWANGGTVDGLPYDLYASDSPAFRDALSAVVRREGNRFRLGSINKEAWHIAILRAGHGSNARALWLDYDAGGGHGHKDGMNLGLFAHGLDLMPDFGYPPVQFGGWGSPRSRWYTTTAAHNTVVVDGNNQANGAGKTTLWADGQRLHAIRVAGPAIAGVERYERTVLLVDVDDTHCYGVDVFRVRGGKEHTKFQHSHFGTLETEGLNLEPADNFTVHKQMKDFHLDPAAPDAWRADWRVKDHYGLLDDDIPTGLRYWDFTRDAAAGTAQAWVVAGIYDGSDEQWIPRLIVRRQAKDDTPLTSTFVAVFEAWREAPFINSVRRIDLHTEEGPAAPDTEVALEVTLQNGQRDLIVLRDPERIAAHPQAALNGTPLNTDAQIALVRLSPEGNATHAALAKGTRIEYGATSLEADTPRDFVEASLD